jgi:hypothetical protein
LALWTAQLEFTQLVEIGVKAGDFSEVLLLQNPKATVHSVDPWFVREEYHDHRGQQVFDRYEKEARERLAKYGKRSVILKEMSHEAELRFKRRSLDFVYVDGHHNLFNAIRDIHLWSGRTRPGGIIACHDYVRFKNQAMHVVQAVHAYTDAYNIRPWFVLGRKSPPDGEYRDKHRTALWVRPPYEANMKDYDPTWGGLTELSS